MASHLRALQLTFAVAIVPPLSGNNRWELVRAPRVYAFDTGLVCWARGWNPLREDDHGLLWEHVVLEFNSRRVGGLEVLVGGPELRMAPRDDSMRD